MIRQPFEIVFEDNYLIVINKIAKILVHASKNDYTLTSFLEKYIKRKVYPCHRLDRETTGLILYAKDRETQRLITEQFRKNMIKKRYIAFVDGKLKSKEAKIEGLIIDREGERFKEKPKKAETFYKVLEEFKDFSVVEVSPLTGRTNQIRIQFLKLGNPILGDYKYAKRKNFKVKFRRLALHAFYLGFYHPKNKNFIEFKIGLSKDMKSFLEIVKSKEGL